MNKADYQEKKEDFWGESSAKPVFDYWEWKTNLRRKLVDEFAKHFKKQDYQENVYLAEKNICWRCGNKLEDKRCNTCTNISKVVIDDE